MHLLKGNIRLSPPKRESDSENYVVEYTDKNIFEGAVGQIALDLLDGLVAAHRKAIEDFENGREMFEKANAFSNGFCTFLVNDENFGFAETGTIPQPVERNESSLCGYSTS